MAAKRRKKPTESPKIEVEKAISAQDSGPLESASTVELKAPAKAGAVAPFKVAPGKAISTLCGIKSGGQPVFFKDLSRSEEKARDVAEILCAKNKLIKS